MASRAHLEKPFISSSSHKCIDMWFRLNLVQIGHVMCSILINFEQTVYQCSVAVVTGTLSITTTARSQRQQLMLQFWVLSQALPNFEFTGEQLFVQQRWSSFRVLQLFLYVLQLHVPVSVSERNQNHHRPSKQPFSHRHVKNGHYAKTSLLL